MIALLLASAAFCASSLAALGVLGALGAFVGGAKILRPTLRVVSWGVVSMGITALVGSMFKVGV